MLCELEIEREVQDYFYDAPWFSSSAAEEAEDGDASRSHSETPTGGTLSLSASMKAPRAFHNYSRLQLMRLRIESLLHRAAQLRAEHEEDAVALPRKQHKLALARQSFEARRLALVERQRAPDLRRLERRDLVAELDLYLRQHQTWCERLRQITRMADVQSQLSHILKDNRPLRRHSALPDLLKNDVAPRPALPAPVIRALLARLDCLAPLMASQSGALAVWTFEIHGLYVFIARDTQSPALHAYIVIRAPLLLLL